VEIFLPLSVIDFLYSTLIGLVEQFLRPRVRKKARQIRRVEFGLWSTKIVVC